MTDDETRDSDAATATDADREDDAPPATADPPRLPPDPAAYDSPRAAAARARGLAAPYIAGGRDPDPERGMREERFYGRILIAMVVIIVLAGFVLGIVAVVFGLPGAE
ncbi:MAG: hypothetical protein ACJ77B_00065 [Chloroflexota bacterium]